MTRSPLPALDINDGDRASQLDLDRRMLGELDGPVPPAHLAATEAARATVPALDIASLRQRAAELERVPARPATRRWLGVVGVPLALAAAALLFLSPSTPDAVRVKGTPQLGWMVLHDGDVAMGARDRTVAPGDRLQFTWAGEADTIVLVGVDGAGEPTVLWPEHPADGPVPLDPVSGLLEGSVELDDAPGPEHFFAVFDAPSVDAATEQVMHALAVHDSRTALHDWADDTPDIDLVIIDKSP